ncbi:MAG: hypothetical protein ACI379_14500 [Nocardioides sp.]|uniref:hypothetical protein n=1 Tax=Nocardioides sp. TaxID=35761 RepID=UPI003F0F43C4
MTEHGTDQLRHALGAATDDLPVRDRGALALAEAGRVRRRRRAVTAGVAVAAVVAAVVVPLWVDGGAEVAPAPSPTGTTGTTPAEPTPTTPTVGAKGDGKLGDHTIWDPATLADLPVTSSLLHDLTPPTSAPSVFDDPVKAIGLVSPVPGRDLMLLGPDNRWRSIPGTAEAAGTWSDGTPHTLRPSLNASGTLLAFATVEGARVIDVRDGSSTVLDWPAGTYPWDTPPALHWTDGDTALVVDDWDRAWRLGLDGSLTEPRWARHSDGEMVTEPDGTLWQFDWKQRQLWRWNDRGIDHKIVDPLTWGAGWVARGDRVAANGSIDAPDSELDDNAYAGPAVLEWSQGEPVAYAPILDKNAVYTDNGHLQLRGFTDHDTLLMVVRVDDFGDKVDDVDTYLVEWAYEEGEFTVLGKTSGVGLTEDGLLNGAVAVDALSEMAR